MRCFTASPVASFKNTLQPHTPALTHPNPSWLAARGHDPHRAAHDLCAHAAWRASFVPQGRVLDSEMERQVAQRKAYVTGPSEVTGAAVVVFCGERHIPL
jgi:hypothetical protein